MRVIYQAVSSLDFVIRVHAFLDVRLRNGHIRRSVLFGLSSLSVETLLARLQLSTQNDTRQSTISHQVQNVRVFKPCRVHQHFTSKVSTGRGCKIRSGTLDRKRRRFSSETGTHAFVSLTRDSISFQDPSATSCLPSFVCQAGIFEIKLPVLSLGQQHQKEKARIMYDSSKYLWLSLDLRICHSPSHFWVHILSGVRRVSGAVSFSTRGS